MDAFRPKSTDVIQIVTARDCVRRDDVVVEEFDALGAHDRHARAIGNVLSLENTIVPHATIWLDLASLGVTAAGGTRRTTVAAHLLLALQQAGSIQLYGGHDGALPTTDALAGTQGDASDPSSASTGLRLFDEEDEIAIVALPDAATFTDDTTRRTAAQMLIDHVERHRTRVAVLDGPSHSSIEDIRSFRRAFDRSCAALYHPWLEVLDPITRQPLLVPPSGAVCGVYARMDFSRGVHAAPANELLLGITGLASSISTAEQQLPNPDGINALRVLPQRGDPRMGRTHAEQLYAVWRGGALLGSTPREAYFVRCDRSTMTQTDLDNGRLLVQIGVAPLRPAESGRKPS